MKILKYLQWFGEKAIKRSTVLYAIASGIQSVVDAIENGIISMTNQIYLMTATGKWLDRWGWDLARVRRQLLESDDAFRVRILLKLFRVKGTRRSVREAVHLITGSYPVEIFEPIRDTAYWNAGFFSIPRPSRDVNDFFSFYDNDFFDAGRIWLSEYDKPTLEAAVRLPVSSNVSAAQDGTGNYCARFGSGEDSSYTGFVKVYSPEATVGGDQLSFYDSLAFLNATQFYGAAKRREIRQEDILQAVYAVKPTGTCVFVEFIQ